MAKRKNPNGAGTIRLKTVIRKGQEYTYWEARYTTGVDILTGKQIQKSVTGKTQSECRKKLTSAISQLDAGNYYEPTKLTVAQWIPEWLNNYCPNIKEYTYFNYDSFINNHIIPALGKCTLSKLTPMHWSSTL